ncbi:reverse transcriptase domain-containing protein [Tanacetum coccineum]
MLQGIPRAITEHSLDTYPYIEPKAQKKRSLAPDMRKVVTDEVNEWLKAGIMTKKGEEKTTFHTEEGVFCYMKMPFGLKNAGVTYQRLVDSAFKEQIGVNLEAYVDDMVIKSRTEQYIIKDIEQTFSTLRRINIKLNSKKCSFGMEEGKFLGYIVTSEGIRANPKKEKAVMDMPSPKTLKQMQSLSGKLAALNRFLSKSAERSLPFLDTLKKCTNKKDFRWTMLGLRAS